MKKYLFPIIFIFVIIFTVVTVLLIAPMLKGRGAVHESDIIPNENEHTEYENVFMSLRLKGRTENGDITFEVLWLNETKDPITFGEQYDIQIKSGDTWESVDTDQQRAWDDVTYVVEGQKARKSMIYSTEGFDISAAGRYRLVVSFNVENEKKKAWIEFDVFNKEEKLADLRRDYPEYFGLDSEKGLSLYVWQTSELNYECGLLQGNSKEHSNSEIWNLESITPDEIMLILDSEYKDSVTGKSLTVVACKMPYSSYYYRIDDYYFSTLKKIFGYDIIQSSATVYGLTENAIGEYLGVKIRSNGNEIIPLSAFSSSTSYHDNLGWLASDGAGVNIYFDENKSFNTWVPTIRKNGNFKLDLGESYSFWTMSVYDLEHNDLKIDSSSFDNLNSLPSGKYYVKMSVHYRGDFIQKENKYESSSYAYLFGIIIE